MSSEQKELLQLISHNKKISVFFRGIITFLFIILAAAFLISIKYSMIMEDNFYRNKQTGRIKTYRKSFMVIMYQNSNHFLTRLQTAMTREADERQIRIDFINVESVDEAVNAINTAVAAKMDGIIAQGIYDADYIQAVNKALDKGITVQYIYTDARGTDRDYFVGYNAYDYGKMAARRTIDEVPDSPSRVALVVQSITDAEKDVTGSLIIEGFKSVIDRHPTIKIVEIVHTDNDLFSAEDTVNGILNRYPDLDVIVCTSEIDTFGAVQVIIDRNRVGKTKLIGVGMSEDILKYIELRVIAASFDMNPEIMSEKSLDIMLEDKAASDYVEIPVTAVTADNVGLFDK